MKRGVKPDLTVIRAVCSRLGLSEQRWEGNPGCIPKFCAVGCQLQPQPQQNLTQVCSEHPHNCSEQTAIKTAHSVSHHRSISNVKPTHTISMWAHAFFGCLRGL